MGVCLHVDMFVHMNFDAGRAERKQTTLAATKISEYFIWVKGTPYLWDFRADFFAISSNQAGSHLISNSYNWKVSIYVWYDNWWFMFDDNMLNLDGPSRRQPVLSGSPDLRGPTGNGLQLSCGQLLWFC